MYHTLGTFSSVVTPSVLSAALLPGSEGTDTGSVDISLGLAACYADNNQIAI